MPSLYRDMLGSLLRTEGESRFASPRMFSSPAMSSTFSSPSVPSRQVSKSRGHRCRADSEASTVVSECDLEAALGTAWANRRKLEPPLEQPLLMGHRAGRERQACPSLSRVLAGLLLATLALGAAGAGGWAAHSWWRARALETQEEMFAAKRGERRLLSVMGRDVWAYAPRAALSGNASLAAVLVLHGSEDYAPAIAASSSFEEVADGSPEPFLAVFPEMSTPGGEVWSYENDMAFFRAVVDRLAAEYNLRRNEVYVCGHSAGGSMSIFLQNNLADVFHAGAAVEAGIGGLPLWNETSTGRPTMLVWNRNDPVLKQFGGDSLLNRTLSKLRRHAYAADMRPSFSLPVATHNATVVRNAEQLLYGASGSAPPLAVVSWETLEPTHHWSNNRNVPGSFDAAQMIWEFFQNTRVADSARA